MQGLAHVTSVEGLNKLISSGPTVIGFYAEWSAPSKQIMEILAVHSGTYPGVNVAIVEAEQAADLAGTCGIAAVPTVLVWTQGGSAESSPTLKNEGFSPAFLATAMSTASSAVGTSKNDSSTNNSSSNSTASGAVNGGGEGEEKKNESIGVTVPLTVRIEQLVRSAPFVLFMKGNPADPKCKFSRRMVELLAKHEIKYSSVDILADEELRQGLKTYASWNSYPQLWDGTRGQLIGGLDIVTELLGEDPEALVNLIGGRAAMTATRSAPAPPRAAAPAAAPVKSDPAAVKAKLEAIISSAPVVLLMKGNPGAPACGFSNKMVGLLKDQGLSYSFFDVYSDQGIREGAKEHFNWPTFPMLIDGTTKELIGGLDVVTAMIEGDEFDDSIPPEAKSTDGVTSWKPALSADVAAGLAPTAAKPTPAEALESKLKQLTTSAPVMLFMKGSPDAPECGFSRKMVALLRGEGIPFSHFNILADPEVRSGLKEFSKWPTFPQLYVGGEFIGGLDIITDMKESGDLADVIAGAEM